jgi:hypothetical protein
MASTTKPAQSKSVRQEVFQAVRPDGQTVEITRDLDTGEQNIKTL